MNANAGTLILSEMLRAFRVQREQAEKALAQLDDDELFRPLGSDENSVAIIMKHVGGNLRSRWTDVLTSDGEKPDRNRDGEFELDHDTAASVRAIWDAGFATVDNTLQALTPADLGKTVTIRGEPHSVVQALHRSLAHTAQHVGQIILLARHWRGPAWQTISIPKAPRRP